MTPASLAQKPRYEILDGLRGVAAIIVVAYHILETYSSGPIDQILNHGYLAVDFFFVLSGFVIGYAYDDRWGKISLKEFFLRRIVRLQPMAIFGTLLGGGLFYFGICSAFPLIEHTPWIKVVLMVILGSLMFPTPPAWDIRGWAETNALNGPMWSLMWEYLANILYALFIRHFSKTALAIFVACCAFLTIDIAFNIDTFGLLSERDYAAYTFIGGWSLTPEQLYIGISRLLYPFFVGLLISRVNKLINIKGGFYLTSLIIAAILVMPRIGGHQHMWMNGAFEAICVLLLFPLIVMMGAGSRIEGRKSIAACKFLGDISYPLYITQFPLIYMQIAWVSNHPDAPTGTHIFRGISIFFISIDLAYASLRLYDEPVREWLRKHILSKSRSRK